MEKVINWESSVFKGWKQRLVHGQKIEAYTDLFFSPLEMDVVVEEIDAMVAGKVQGLKHLPGKGLISYYEFAVQLAKLLAVNPSLVVPSRGNLSKRRPFVLR